MTLPELFEHHKGLPANKFPHHMEIYERLFNPMLDVAQLGLLEIGLGHGGSLEIWRKYFGKQACIAGLDIQDLTGIKVDATIFQGDQTDKSLLRRIASQCGPLHIIIDDGSHRTPDQQITFETLFPLLQDGGVYIVEDIHTSYRTEFGGSGKHDPNNIIEFLKDMVDGMHMNEWAGVADTTHIFGIEFYPSMAVVHKRNPGAWGGPTVRPAEKHQC